jgi:uncharacterized phiE125 gp8 family phage protein
MALVRATDATEEPVTVAEMREHLRVVPFEETGYLAGLITAARRHIGDAQNRSFVDTVWNLWMDEWPPRSHIVLPRAPLRSVASVSWFDAADAETVVSSASYIVDTYSQPGRIVLRDGYSWPTGSLRAANGVKVAFTAGYGTDASSVPANTKHLIKLLVSHWWDNREPELVGTVSKQLPKTLESLIWMDRLVLGL